MLELAISVSELHIEQHYGDLVGAEYPALDDEHSDEPLPRVRLQLGIGRV